MRCQLQLLFGCVPVGNTTKQTYNFIEKSLSITWKFMLCEPGIKYLGDTYFIVIVTI